MSSRDTAKASLGLSYQAACDINHVLERLGLIETIRVGDQRPNGKAAEFRYLLPEPESAEEDDDEIPV